MKGPAPPYVRTAAGDTSASPVQNASPPIDDRFVAVAREMMQHSRREQEVASSGGGTVPWSLRAAVLAGLGAAFLQAGLLIVAAKGSIEFIPGVKIFGDGDASWLLMLVLYGLLSGARIAVTTLMFTHFALRFVQLTSLTAYAVGGAVSGCIHAYGLQMLSGGGQRMLTTAATGFAAGYLYRVFSGIRAG